MRNIVRDNQRHLIYMEKGDPSNPPSKNNKEMEATLKEQQNLLLKQITYIDAPQGESFCIY